MRVPNLLRQGSVSFNMTPMIDVVFLLIIFFLVSSHLAKQEAQLELPLPVAETGRLGDEQAPRVIVNILADGQLLLAGHRLEAGQLAARLRSQREAEGENVELKIRGDREVPYRMVQPVLLAATQAGIWNVTVSVYRPEDVR
ncbi:MAG: biopolymer transporter ExbD [Planctomycetales bacterium]|nr:biopolymer transporter ExbD [Planctomycetales bacterium]